MNDGPERGGDGFDADDLMSLETYEREREHFHALVMAHRRHRTVQVGPNATLVFEDALTVRHQLQETLRRERISGAAEVRAEVDAWATLLPDGSSFKATLTLEFGGDARAAPTAMPAGVEQRVWLQVDGTPRLFAVVQAGPARTRTSAPPEVHNLCLELDKPRLRDLRKGSRLSVGIDHDGYRASLVLGDEMRRQLLRELR